MTLAPAGLLAERVTAGLLSLLLAGVTGAPAQDEIRDRQWHLDFLNIEQAHTISTGEGVIVGVVDTGVDGGHPDLAGTLLPGADFSVLDRPDAWEDRDGHGTAMAGIIAAHGITLGIAPDATILPVRHAADGGSAFSRTTADSIHYAVDQGATVLCLAFNFDEFDQPALDLEYAVEQAIANDVVVIAAIGHVPDSPNEPPASYPGVLGAVGVDRDGNHPEWSVVSPHAALAAPAVDIMTARSRTVVPSGYGAGSGNSDATAIIAGVAALIRAEYPELSAADVIHRMTATADDRGEPGRDEEYGFGIVNPVAALTADIPPLEPSDAPATAPPTQPSAGGPGRVVGLLVLVAAAGVGIVLLVVVGLVIGLRRRT